MTLIAGVAGLLTAFTGAILAYQHGYWWLVAAGCALTLGAACKEAGL